MKKNIESFLDKKRASNCSELTIKNYRSCIDEMYRWLVKIGISDDKNITSELVQKYINDILLKKNTINSVATKVSIIKNYLLHLTAIDILPGNVVYNIDAIKREEKLPEILTQEVILKVIESLNSQYPKTWINMRNIAIIYMFYDTGVRTSELINIKIKDINFKTNTVRVDGKGRKTRIVPFSSETAINLKLLIQYYERNRKKVEYLFITQRANKLKRESVYTILRTIFQEHGHTLHGGHELRHSFATHMLNNGAPINDISEMLGHSDIKTTRIYAKISTAKMMESHSKFHPLNNNN